MADDTESDTEPDIREASHHELTQDDSSPIIVPRKEFSFVVLKLRTSEHSVKVFFKPGMPPQVAGRDPNCDIFLGDNRLISWNQTATFSLATTGKFHGTTSLLYPLGQVFTLLMQANEEPFTSASADVYN